MIMIAASSIAILLFGSAIWYFYTQGGTEDNGEVPLIEAPDGPDKVEPEDAGGLDVPDQDKLVFDVVSGDETRVALRGQQRLMNPTVLPFISLNWPLNFIASGTRATRTLVSASW